MSNPNTHSSEPASPKSLASIIKNAETILNASGVEKPDTFGTGQKMMSAHVPIDRTSLVEAKPDVLPTIKINKPIGDFAKKARWGYEITYGMQEAGQSRHVLILNGEAPLGEMSFYDGTPDRTLTEGEAQKIAVDLSSIAPKE